MKNLKALLMVFCLFITPVINFAQTYVWTQKASLPSQPRMGAAGFSIGDKGYTVGGYTGISVLKETWEYDSPTNTWSQKADLPGSVRYNASGFAVNNKGYVCLGWATTTGSVQLNDLWEYDPINNSWTAKAAFPGGARYTASAFVIGNAAYVGLGYQPLYSDFYRYEPALNLWTQIASLPSGNERQSAGSFAMNGLGYIVCGNKANASYFKDLWQYNPVLNLWTKKSDIPGDERLGPASFQINNLGFAGLGSKNNALQSDSYFYNDTTDQWISAPQFPGILRESPSCFEMIGSGFVAFGKHAASGVFLNDTWVLSDLLTISATENKFDINIWPVPAFDVLHISSLKVFNYVKIFDRAGTLVWHSLNFNSVKIEVELNQLPAGNYLLMAGNDKWSASRKIFKY